MAIEGTSPTSRDIPSVPSEEKKIPRKEIQIEGMKVAVSLEGLPSAPSPKAIPDQEDRNPSAVIVDAMVKSVAENSDLAKLVSLSSEIIKGEITYDKGLDEIAKEETGKDRKATKQAEKEELADKAETVRVDNIEIRSSEKE